MQFGIFWLIYGHFQHVGYQKACTWAMEFSGNTFTHSSTSLHTFKQFSCNLGYFGQFWAIFNMVGIKIMYSSWEVQWCYFLTLSHTPSRNLMNIYTQFRQFGLFRPILGNFQHVGYQNSKSMFLSWRIQLLYFYTLTNSYMHFHAIFMQFGLFSANLELFSTYWVSKSMYSSLGIEW